MVRAKQDGILSDRGDPDDDRTIEAAPGRADLRPTESQEIPDFVREDLSDDWALTGCERISFGAGRCPRVGEYPLLRRIGHGGMGVVYAGLHPRLGTEVAVKLLRRELSERDETLHKRFLREARLAAKLSNQSQHLVRVHDVNFDEDAQAYYLVMEYVAGPSAQKWMRDGAGSDGVGPASELDVLAVCAAATTGLAVAHSAGVVHRDVKPDNILIPEVAGRLRLSGAKLADLGLARAERKDAGLTADHSALFGTPGYAAPEQLESAGKARKPADVFAMGATIYALFAGHAPFRGDNAMARAVATLESRYRPLQEVRPGVSASVVALVDTCLRRDPHKRFPDAAALSEGIALTRSAVRDGSRISSPVTTQVVELVERSEVGKSVLSSFASSLHSGPPRLVLESGPPGTDVTLTRDSTPPLRFTFRLGTDGRFETTSLEPGPYRLLATHPDHHDLAAGLELRRGGDTHFVLALRARQGRLTVESAPPGARVLLGQETLGDTPLRRVAVPAGSHELTLRLDGYGEVTRAVEIRGGKLSDLGVLALARCSHLSLASFPDEVVFSLGDHRVVDGEEIDPGTHRLRVTRKGYEPQVVNVEVAAGQALVPRLEPWRPDAWALMSERVLWRAASPDDRCRAAEALAAGSPDLGFLGLEDCGTDRRPAQAAVFFHEGAGVVLVLVPGDTFTMGSPIAEPGHRSDERSHRVTLSPFLIAREPLTQAAWTRDGRSNPSRFSGDELPVEQVSWEDALEFCETVGLDLPTEAQWECACRAGSPDRWWFGDDESVLSSYAWTCEVSDGRSRRVSGKLPNGFGLFGVHGGVWEWCRDGYGEYPFEHAMEPTGPPAAAYRVFRGGSWSDKATFSRSAERGAFRPDYRWCNLGFRPARPLRRRDVARNPKPGGSS